MAEIDRSALTTAMAEAASKYINSQQPDLPPLLWTVHDDTDGRWLTGHVSVADYPDPAMVAAQWCAALNLSVREVRSGTHEFVGSVNGMHVEVWYVADRSEFERK